MANACVFLGQFHLLLVRRLYFLVYLLWFACCKVCLLRCLCGAGGCGAYWFIYFECCFHSELTCGYM